MIKNGVQFGIVLLVFFAIDMVWLGVVAKGLYAKHLGYIMATKVNWSAALVFYLLFIVGLLVFVIQPALVSQSLSELLLKAALFGLVTYATYDLTNLATLRDWPLMLSIVDMIWGAFLSTSTAAITYLIMSRI